MKTERQPVEMAEEELVSEIVAISEHRAQPYLTEERKQQLTLKMNRILFEYNYRHGDYGGNDAA